MLTTATLGAAAGTASFNASTTIGSLHARGGGTLGGSGDVAVSSLTLNGGTITGTGAFTVTGPTLISTNATDNPTSAINHIVGRTLTNAGLATQTGADLRLNSGAVWNNQAGSSYTVTDDSGMLSFTLPGTFNNAGVFTKAGGSGSSLLTNLSYNNAGVANVQSGTLSFNNTGGTHAGVFNLAAGATLRFGAGNHVFAGSVNGVPGSTVNFASTSTYSVDGTMTVGTLIKNTGTLNGTGDLTVTDEFDHTGGTFGTTWRNLLLTRAADFSAGLFAATNSLTLRAPAGAIIDGNGALLNASAPSVTLSARDGIGAIDPIEVATNALVLSNGGTGAVAVSSMPLVGNALALTALNPAGALTVGAGTADIQLTVGAVAAGTVALSTSGSVQGVGTGIHLASTSGAPGALSVQAGTGIGTTDQPLMVQPASSTELVLNNTGSGDIVILQPVGDLVVGAGGASLRNVAVGGYGLLAGGDVVLNAGLPSAANLVLGAGNDVIVNGSHNATGTIAFSAGRDVLIGANVTAGAQLAVGAGGEMRLMDAVVSAPVASVTAAGLAVAAGGIPTALAAGSSLAINLTGDMQVSGGGVPDASAAVTAGPGANSIAVGRDLLIRGGSAAGTNALVRGDPDVQLTVGGTVRIDSGGATGGSARLESVSPSSIYIHFPNLSAGGYYVNGIESGISDLQSGMFAGGAPAVLDTNLLISYGLVGLPLVSPALAEQIKESLQAVNVGIEAIFPGLDLGTLTNSAFKVIEQTSEETGDTKARERMRRQCN